MQPQLLKKYAQPVPRYTSYPTAPHFTSEVAGDVYRSWLERVPSSDAGSLYVHIPYCEQLCWYCGCATRATRRYGPVAAYLDALSAEIGLVAGVLGLGPCITHMHWGGGSPSILSPVDIGRLASTLRTRFRVDDKGEFAVEIDPRTLTHEKIAAFVHAGVTRVSIGVQDFSAAVQEAINRRQSFDMTRRAVDGFRQAGVRSINIDLVYGLPRQTRDSMAETTEQVVTLAPDRIALFGYAHLPQRIAHQRLIDAEALPDMVERFAQANRTASLLTAAGYVRVGLDHFARPGDPLAAGQIKRNFQGYTTDAAGTLIGVGASAIGRLEQGYVQNAVPIGAYERLVMSGQFATARGRILTRDDRTRAAAIEGLLCDLSFSAAEIETRFGRELSGSVIAIAKTLIESDTDQLVEPAGDDGSFDVTEKGRLFIRSICACFDAYLDQGHATYSSGV